MIVNQTFKNGTILYWSPGSDGGGTTQYADFISVLERQNKTYKRGLEWCAGLGAIGYSIIDSNICHSFAFMDIHEPALHDINHTALVNGIQDRVTTYHCNSVSKIPVSEKFDLVVGNPPHCISIEWLDKSHSNYATLKRLTADEGWVIHKDFFCNIKPYLTNGADIYLSEIDENFNHSMLVDASFVFIESFPAPLLEQDSKTPGSCIMHYRYEAKIY